MQPWDKLSSFYLGRRFDVGADAITDETLLYDSKDLCTHAVCLGMTGSGKTGLCLSLLEEAALDGIPAIAIDPKGDIGNLKLNFPQLRAQDFKEWVDPGEATRKGMDKAAYARKTADTWRKGLAEWGQDGERMQRLKAAADVSIYTPGSTAGLPLAVLRSFTAPPQALLDDADAMRERVQGAVSGLLAMLGIDPDPIRSREHILLSNILDTAWRQGRDLNLAALIREIQAPPFKQIGVFDLESFFPANDRFALAMTLNNLLASPGFSVWMEGDPLDVQRLLWTADGKPRLTVFSINHLSDSERMFFVTLLLSEVLAWMRTQPGTTSLRALLYMDEIFGFFPPTANPPSKTPMLTLLKQARAYGLGCVLATQNPVDLDYKGLSNTGTWFLGRLQTERDKARVLDGLEGVASSEEFDRGHIERVLAGLKSRVFYMKNIHDDEPTIFHTRWAMSYLRGPLTRGQVKTLMDPHRPAARTEQLAQPAAAGTAPAAVTMSPASAPAPAPAAGGAQPVVPPKVPQVYVMRSRPVRGMNQLIYRPALLGQVRLHYASATQKVDEWTEDCLVVSLGQEVPETDLWEEATSLKAGAIEMDEAPEPQGRFADLPVEAAKSTSYTAWKKDLKAFLYRERRMLMWRSPELKVYSTAGETEGDFRARLAQLSREKRDLAIEKLRKKYSPKLARLQDRVRKADQKIEVQQDQVSAKRKQSWLSVGATVLGAVFGRKTASIGTVSRASTTMRTFGSVGKEKEDVKRAIADRDALQVEMEEMEAEFEEQVEELKQSIDPQSFDLDEKPLRPRKTDIDVKRLALAWMPWSIDASGIAEPAFDRD